MLDIGTSRPRDIDWKRAASILYGDWGTSKAYIIGLAFAVAGYSSFWLIVPMCLLTALVGFNYITICRLYPNGGGVYASVRHRSEIISIVGAFLMVADYIVTAALSALSAFSYLGVAHPAYYAGGAILIIGLLNFFGPKHTGLLAIIVSVPTVLVVIVLGLFALPHLGTAVAHLHPLHGGIIHNWVGFVSIVLALSGVEAIANTTGIMKLNPGSSPGAPVVTKTSTRALLVVLIEVVGFTALLGLAMAALPGLTITNSEVNAPGAEGVRDYMLRYMAQVFVGHSCGPTLGNLAGWVVSITFGFLLLSAVNTAITGLLSISFLMSKDDELPPVFAKLNQFGVPHFSLLVMTLIPAGLVIFVGDMTGLAELYAVGVVGAIATNLGATFTDRKLPLLLRERLFMAITFIILVAIEVTLFVEKPAARVFAVTILAVGLILRGLAREHSARKAARMKATAPFHHQEIKPVPITSRQLPSKAFAPHALEHSRQHHGAPILAAVRGLGKTLDFAVSEAQETGRPLYVMFVREQPVIAPGDRKRKWFDDAEAKKIFESLQDKGLCETILPCYTVSDAPMNSIVDLASTIGAERVIIGASQRGALINMLRGDMISMLSKMIPEDMYLVVCG
ncbi:MAG: APC family permease [Chthoniobacterales bacterium]|nr:APC family permease [Chthoniobacterales bacterium]